MQTIEHVQSLMFLCYLFFLRGSFSTWLPGPLCSISATLLTKLVPMVRIAYSPAQTTNSQVVHFFTCKSFCCRITIPLPCFHANYVGMLFIPLKVMTCPRLSDGMDATWTRRPLHIARWHLILPRSRRGMFNRSTATQLPRAKTVLSIHLRMHLMAFILS